MTIRDDLLTPPPVAPVDALANLRAHAAKIRTILETPGLFELHNVSIWRALYVVDGRGVAAKLVSEQGVGNSAHVTRRYGDAYATQYCGGPIISPEEIAVFLGLESVPVETLEWVRAPHKSPLAIVSGGIVPTQAKGPRMH